MEPSDRNPWQPVANRHFSKQTTLRRTLETTPSKGHHPIKVISPAGLAQMGFVAPFS